MAPVTKTKVPKYMRGGRPIGPDVRETPDEIRRSRTSPGEVRWAHKNRAGGIWAWLAYDFEFGKSKLKSGHIRGLKHVLNDLISYGRIYGARASILVSGHASPSGKDKVNQDLAVQRAGAVMMWLIRQPKVSSSWFTVPNVSEVYSVVKGRPTTAQDRRLCRGVYVILPHMRTRAKVDVFPGGQRQRALSQIRGRFSGYEAKFYMWIINNFDNVMKYRYCRRAVPQQDGLFFAPPSSPLTTDLRTWSYLKPLYREFTAAADRTSRYIGAQGSMLRAPVQLSFQQLGRWLALDQHTRKSHPYLRDVTSIASFERSMKQLIKWVYEGKYGDSQKIKAGADKYAKKHKIPIEFPNKATQFIIVHGK